jgi:5-methylcytosine-specific restriction endonuclease McrA
MDIGEQPPVDDTGDFPPRHTKQHPHVKPDVQVRVFQRDKWLCRYCGKPVIFPPSMKFLQQYVKNRLPDANLAYWSFTYRRDASPLLDELAVVVDHVHAFSAGGGIEESNLATACNKCNMRKSNMGETEFRKKNPLRPIKSAHGEPVYWDGFSTLFLVLGVEHLLELTRSERAWYDALKSATGN